MHEKSVALRREIGDADGLADSLSGLVKQAHRLGDYAEALRIGQEVLEIFLDLGNIWAAALALGHLSFVALDKGDYEDASRYAQRQLKLAQEVGEPDSMAFAYLNLGRSSNAQGQYEEAKAPLEQARNIYLQLGNPNFAIFSSCVLASVLLSRNRPEQASRLIDDAHQMAQSADKPFHVAPTHYLKGHLALIREDYGAALHSFQESLAEWGGQYLMQDIIYRVDAIASVATYLDQATLAAQLFGAINERYPFECHPMAPFEWELHNRGIAAARAALGDAEFEAAYAAGQRMSLDEAIALARCH
jgi:tetratricopeptide (TPR) repeat protein